VGQLVTEESYGAQTKADSVSHSLEKGSNSGKYPLERISKHPKSKEDREKRKKISVKQFRHIAWATTSYHSGKQP